MSFHLIPVLVDDGDSPRLCVDKTETAGKVSYLHGGWGREGGRQSDGRSGMGRGLQCS